MEIGNPKKSWSFLTKEDLVLARQKVDWSGINLNHVYYNHLVCGNPEIHYLQYFIKKYVNQPFSILSLGCGNGHLERALLNFGIPYKRILGIDLNEDLTNYANSQIKKLGFENVEYRTNDLNSLVLPSSEYDLIIFFHSLHHVENLEYLLDEVNNSLTEHGIVLIVEYVGPTRFQWVDEQLRIAQILLDILPDELKIDLRNPDLNSIKRVISKPRIEDVIKGDYSEAIRSSEILDLLQQKFEVTEKKPLGGSILSLLFDGIAGNFNEENPIIRSLIKSFQNIEELLISYGIIDSDFIFMVLKKKHLN